MIPDISPLFTVLTGIFIISVPLSIWKLIDIAIWIYQHVAQEIEVES